jgi:hypothetical protein
LFSNTFDNPYWRYLLRFSKTYQTVFYKTTSTEKLQRGEYVFYTTEVSEEKNSFSGFVNPFTNKLYQTWSKGMFGITPE